MLNRQTIADKPTSLKTRLFLLFSCTVTIFVLAYILSRVSIEEILTLILRADRRAILMFFVCSTAMSIFRTWRYAMLLSLSGHNIRSLPLFLTVLVRNFCSDLLPARIGSTVYIFILNTRLGIPLNAATSSFALALLFDALSIAPIIFVAVVLIGSHAMIPKTGILIASIMLCVLSLMLIHFLPLMLRVASALPAKISFLKESWQIHIAGFFSRIDNDVERIRDSGLYFRIFLLSILIRLGKYCGLYFFLFALLRPLGYELINLPAPKVFIGFLVPEFAASLPISGIAGIGAYQGAWIFIFQLLGFPAEIATVTSVSHHIFTQAYGYSLGLLSLLILQLPSLKTQTSPGDRNIPVTSKLKFYTWITLTLLIVAVLLCGIYYLPVG